MKLISWNVNGIRACIKKGFIDYLELEAPDMIGIQETKGRLEQLEKIDVEKIQSLGYEIHWNPAKRPGYSGTAIFTKIQPLSVYKGIDIEKLELDEIESCEIIENNHEGRVITLEFDDFYLSNVYTPNSKRDLSRLDYRYNSWDIAYLKFLKKLEEKKPVITCGDFNVAHKEIDIARPKANTKSAGFTREEREGMDNYIEAGLVDTFRHISPNETDAYSWWSYMGGARDRNVGWRIDYFLVSEILKITIKDAYIRNQVMGSDHCPVGIEI